MLRIRKRFFPDPGSLIPNPYFGELIENIDPYYFLQHLKIRLILNFVKFVATKNNMKIFFLTFSFVAVFGSGIRDLGWVKIRIRDPGSATLLPVLELQMRHILYAEQGTYESGSGP